MMDEKGGKAGARRGEGVEQRSRCMKAEACSVEGGRTAGRAESFKEGVVV